MVAWKTILSVQSSEPPLGMYGLVLKTLKKERWTDKLHYQLLTGLDCDQQFNFLKWLPHFSAFLFETKFDESSCSLVQNTTLSFAQKAWTFQFLFWNSSSLDPMSWGLSSNCQLYVWKKSVFLKHWIISWYFAFLGVYGPNSTSALDPFLLPEREAKDHRICENNPKCVLYWHEGLGGQGWMGLDGWRGLMGLGVYCKLWEIWWNMMVWNKGFRPWIVLFAGCDGEGSGLQVYGGQELHCTRFCHVDMGESSGWL